MRSRTEYERVRRLLADGLNDSEVSRATRIPRSTAREWRIKPYRPPSRSPGPCDGTACHTIDHARAFGDVYAYLLGLYLGDGTISEVHRGVERLRLFLDLRYPDIIDGAAAAMAVVRGSDRIGFVLQPGCVAVSSYWKHWGCAFPQRGPGMKHTRDVGLQGWQKNLTDRYPHDLLRGLFESDGCRFINPVRHQTAGGEKVYRYTRYTFTNESTQIRGLFTTACETIGVSWTQTNARTVAVSRRDDVAVLDRFLGRKR